jgi:hypothetical protein
MQLLKETLFLLLAFLDAEFTKRRLSELGLDAELNPFIRWLGSRIGVETGVDLGIILPTGGLAILGWFFPELLTFMIGVRFCLFLFQQRSRYGN